MEDERIPQDIVYKELVPFQIALLKATKSATIDDIRTCLDRGGNANVLNEVRLKYEYFMNTLSPFCYFTYISVRLGRDVNATSLGQVRRRRDFTAAVRSFLVVW